MNTIDYIETDADRAQAPYWELLLPCMRVIAERTGDPRQAYEAQQAVRAAAQSELSEDIRLGPAMTIV